jgi:hypothetical protein
MRNCFIAGAYINKREVTGRFRVKPGNYILIPSTYEQDKEGEFLVRIFTEGESTGKSLNIEQPETVIDQFSGVFFVYFEELGSTITNNEKRKI